MTFEDLKTRLAKPRFPRAAQYDPARVIDCVMGPNVLWLAEYLSQAMKLEPGMHVLDLGCGKALSSIFFAREFGVQVTAADLWIKPSENLARIEAAGLGGRVVPVHAEAHALPFAAGQFDAIVSLDAYQYFGTDDLYLGTIAQFLRPGGRLGIVCPGLAQEIVEVPPILKQWWEWDFCCFHSPAWWRHHWAKTGLVTVEHADWMEDGHGLWLDWYRAALPYLQGFHAKSGRNRYAGGRYGQTLRLRPRRCAQGRSGVGHRRRHRGTTRRTRSMTCVSTR
ncbi:MAG: methyltransferase domain-containing protein [Rhizomicrobium sp.]